MKPLISIITPVYNQEKFIYDGIQTIVDQTLNEKYYEWIIFDDGSTDNTLDNINRRIKGLKNILCFSRKKNLGTSHTREEAIKFSKGEYLVFFDMDDLLEKDALQSTLSFMKSNYGVEFSYSKHKRVNEEGNFICNRPGHPYSRDKLLHFNFIGHLKCVSRKLHFGINGFNPNFSKYSEDYDYVLRASEFLEEDQIKQNPEYLYSYRIHLNNNMKNVKRMQENACLAIKNSLKRKEKINGDVFWSHITPDKYNYYNWEVNQI